MAHDDGWGGEWTEDKLRVLRGYLEAYLTALKNQPFRLGYIDCITVGSNGSAPARLTPGLLTSGYGIGTDR